MAAQYSNISASAQIKIGIGKIKGLFVCSGTNPTIAVYDSATASTSDPKILATFTGAVPSSLPLPGDGDGIGFSKGLYVVLGGTNPVVTVIYE